MSATQLDLLAFSARAARREAERGMAATLEAAPDEWRQRVLDAIEGLAASGREFISDDVRALTGDPPAGVSPNSFGALMAAVAKSGRIRFVGYGRSARVVGHGNRICVWAGAAP